MSICNEYFCKDTDVSLNTDLQHESLLLLTFILPGWVFKFQSMAYEECGNWTEKDKIMK